MFRGIVIACTVSLAVAGAAQAQVNLVSHGDFNSPSVSGTQTLAAGSTTLTGWTVDSASPQSNGIEFGAGIGGTFPSGPGLTGSQGVMLGKFSNPPPTFKVGGIQQTIPNTIPGQAYTITIYAKDVTNGAATIGTVNFGGQAYTLTGLNKTTWTPFTFSEMATNTSTVLDITGNTVNQSDETIIADLSIVFAQSNTAWVGGSSSDYGNPANWNTGYLPSGQGIAVMFGTSGARSTSTLVSSSQTAGIINFVSSTPTTLSASAGYYLYLDDTGGSSAAAAINVTGSHTIAAPMLLNCPAAFNVTAGTDQLTISNVIADGVNGPQGLSLSGSGTLKLSAANTMSGSVSVASGTLLLSSGSALQDATLASGGVSFNVGITSPVLGALTGAGAFSLVTTTGQAVTLNVGNTGQSTTFGGALSGGGSLVKIGSGALTLRGANTFSGNTYVSSGTLVVDTSLALQNSPLDPSGTGTFSFGTPTAATLGGLTNTGTLNLVNVSSQTVNLNLNVAGNLTFNGSVTGPGSVTMIGAGLQVLSGTDSYAGGSNVNGGTLQFKGGTGTSLPASSLIGLGGGVVSIANDGTGSGGTISLGNNITLTAGATVGIDVRNNGSGHINNIVSFGTLSNGTSANALNSTINFTAANGYRPTFAGLNLPGATGYTTVLNPTTTTVVVLGDVNNQMNPTTTGQYDTLVLDGTTTGNTIFGTISNPAFAGVNYGDTRITKSNISVWILAGTGNSYVGPTVITGGTLQLGTGQSSAQDGTLGSTSGVSNSGALVYNYVGSVTANYSISGTGSVSMIGPGGITLTSTNSYTGPTNISNGTLALASNGAIAQSSTISLSAGATFDVSQVAFQLAAGQALSGTGNYTVSGGLTLGDNSTLLPGGVASAGTLNTGGLTLSPSSKLKFDLGSGQDLINVGTSNGGLTINGGSIGLYQADGTTPFTSGGTYLLMNYGSGNFVNGSVNSLSVLNPSVTNVYTFSATGGSLNVTISPPDIWNGGSGGPSFVWSNGSNWTSGLAPSSGTSVMFAGTTGLSNTNNIPGLTLTGFLFSPTAGAFNISGNSIQLAGPIVNLSPAAQTIGMNILLSGTQNVVASAGTIALNGVIDDGGQAYGINITGSGTVVLGGANTYSGTTNVSGPLRLANPLALQNSTLNLSPSGGSVTFAAGTTAGSIAALAGSGTGGITLTSNGQPVTLTVGSTGLSSTFAGMIKGIGSLVKQGGGTLTLTGAATYTGATVVAGGTLQLLGSPQSGAGSTISGFGGNGAGWTLNSSNGTKATIVNDVLTLTFAGTNEARSAFLNQLQPVAAFNASFTYQETTGTSGVADGVALVWQNSGPTARGTTGGGLGYGGITPSAAVEINIYSGHALGTNYAINGATGTYLSSSPVNPASSDPIRVSISYDGVNMLTETMLDTTTNQTYSTVYTVGDLATTVGGESAYIGFTGATGGLGSTQKISNFSYSLINILPTSTALTITNGSTVDLTGIYQTVASLSSTDGQGSKVFFGNGGLTIAGTSITTFDGVIAGGSGALPSLTIQSGMLTLTGQNTYAGVTSILNGGTLQLASGANGDGSISSSIVNDNGTLLYKFSDNQTIGYRITGQGTLRTAGGVLTLTATNTYLGATAINGGTLQLGNGQQGQDGVLYNNLPSGVVTDNGALIYDLVGSQTAAYSVSGSGSLSLINTGTLTLSGTNNSYTGGTYVAAGTLIVTKIGAIADGSSLTVGNASFFPAAVVPTQFATPVASPVPEPATLALIASAIVAAGLKVWRRRKRRT
jgi:autotransporter-associated beta strand protein